MDAFGNVPEFEDRSGLTPHLDIEILGASSDHSILDAKETGLSVGDEVRFDVDYGAMLAAMTSPYVTKVYLNEGT